MPFDKYWCSYIADASTDYTKEHLHVKTTYNALYGLSSSAKSYCLSFEKAQYSSFYASDHDVASVAQIPQQGLWQPTFTSPCCGLACELHVQRAQMLFWPTPAPVAGISTVVGPDGFT